MGERFVIEVSSEKERQSLVELLEVAGYLPHNDKVKVCGLGMCGEAPLYTFQIKK